MLDLNGTLERVHQGLIPPDWQEFYGRRIPNYRYHRSRARLIPFYGLFRIARIRAEARRNARSESIPDPDPPLLVITPDGFVEYVGLDQAAVGVAFSDLVSLALRVTASTSEGSMFAHTHIWLDLRYRTGNTDRWVPRTYFGQTEAVAQAIIAAHGKYEAAH